MEPLLFNSGEAISWEKAEEWERTLLKWYKEKAKMKNLTMEEKKSNERKCEVFLFIRIFVLSHEICLTAKGRN